MAISDLVKINYSKLNENDLYIWKYIDSHKKECRQMTIEELASHCNVSRTTILRFAKKLNMEGFSELKIHLKMEESSSRITQPDIVQAVCNDYRKRIDEMEKNDFKDVCEMLYKASRIFVYGSGAVQSFVAKELKRAFLSANICIFDIDGNSGEQQLISNLLTPDDLVIIVSLSGESNHVVNFAKTVKLKGVPILSMTKLKHNTLASLSTENLYISTSNVNTYIQNYETTTLFFMTVEMLLIKYLLYLEKQCDEISQR